MRKLWLILVTIPTILTMNYKVMAENNISNSLKSSNHWQIELTPYFWAAEIDGDVTLRGRKGSVDVSFSEIMDNLYIAFMTRLETWKNNWGIFLDGLYMDVESDFSRRGEKS